MMSVAAISFIKLQSSDQPATYLSRVISERLAASDRVIWLLPGGSAIQIAVKATDLLAESATNLEKLQVSLSDERYGPVGHSDSNWQQLVEAGLALPGARLQPVLKGLSLPETTKAYDQSLANDFANADYRIGLLGIGEDGHIAGIKPGSPAIHTNAMAVGYKWNDYIRLSMSAAAISRLDEVVVYAAGEAKRQVLEQLDQDVAIAIQPAQILKRVPRVSVYNDVKGD